MSYLVLARKWRPQRFEDLQGQEAIVTVLRNAIGQSRIAHAYLFSGPRGVGKTSAARIMAKSLNCVEGPTSLPCGRCPFCTSITDGSSVDVIEIDGASNNSVDDIRDLRERVKYAPAGGRYKVYIIDEAHMLSGSAFNALLKTLEEPPPHVVFVLATTAPNKIPITVLSRCQHLPFKRIPSRVIRDRLQFITGAEKIALTERALDVLARSADGSMRDALTLLDQASAFSAEIREEDLMALLGLTDASMVLGMVNAVISSDRPAILALTEQVYERGLDVREFARAFISVVRDLLVCKVLGGVEAHADLDEERRRRIADLLPLVSEEQLTLLLDLMISAENEIRLAAFPRVALEMVLMKASFLARFRDVGEILKKLPSAGAAPPKGEGKRAVPAKKPVDDSAEQTCVLPPHLAGGTGLWESIVRKVDERDHVLACKLSHATGTVAGDVLSITFNGGFAVHADAVLEKRKMLEDLATELAARRVRVEVATKKVEADDMREKVLGNSAVKDALELFEGRIVDIRPKGKKGR